MPACCPAQAGCGPWACSPWRWPACGPTGRRRHSSRSTHSAASAAAPGDLRPGPPVWRCPPPVAFTSSTPPTSASWPSRREGCRPAPSRERARGRRASPTLSASPSTPRAASGSPRTAATDCTASPPTASRPEPSAAAARPGAAVRSSATRAAWPSRTTAGCSSSTRPTRASGCSPLRARPWRRGVGMGRARAASSTPTASRSRPTATSTSATARAVTCSASQPPAPTSVRSTVAGPTRARSSGRWDWPSIATAWCTSPTRGATGWSPSRRTARRAGVPCRRSPE